MTFNGKTLRVKAINAQLVDGILECTYYFALKSGFAAPAITNKMASGRMMTGIVQKVEADRVQVFLNTIDTFYDSGGDWWFPYSTAYSSQDGSGWYSMPAVGDQVRVFFPSDNEGEAFAASSVAKHVRPRITDRCWRGVNGKQLLMTEEGLIIICKDGKIFINLTEDNILGKLDDDRYMRMYAGYEQEQKDLVKSIADSEKQLVSMEQKSTGLHALLAALREMTDITELNQTMVNKLIQRIEVHNNEKKHSHNGVKVDIYFTAVGMESIPDEKEILRIMEAIQARQKTLLRLSGSPSNTKEVVQSLSRLHHLLHKILPLDHAGKARGVFPIKFKSRSSGGNPAAWD